MKENAVNAMWGVAIAATTMLIPYQYCMDGPGRGFPFAICSPSCGAWFPVFSFDESKIPQTFDLGGGLADMLLWGAIAGFLRNRLSRRRPVSPGITVV